ncbi:MULTISPECIES: NAD(P)-dependent oxidoreductase [Geobacter]|uniref:3-hydroxyisobutyrate dehydrogenase n=2 Tax=Geobacter TaxID=28231 RepID=A0A0C1U468_9BACT|nr:MULTISPECIES: NAD(P)-dependent oxidoreductase [Geobacter]ANA40526.1 3-hydroxyisobutyrate dehydrogenase [Geobacter anodireducens]KIE42560.1 3-hydroxyisobutyrate dehydrogenase [Geobacter soli]MBE2887579.1 NAD(P)-dependent oxidoreductase [Geobacter anodireducens]HMN02560.1 NAD(P)-dependent oxidoreductase [Geobacter anodireducens]
MLRKVGFLGLGTVGRHMAANLLKGNYELTVYDSDPKAVADLAALGATGASAPREAAKGRDIVIHIRPEKERLRPDIYGPDGIFAGIDPGTILVDMGTHSLTSTMEMADEAAKHRVMYLDAPVWGTKEHAANGLLTILAGGDPSLVGRCRELFSFFGLNIIHVGSIGDATRMKLVVNLVQAELMQALAESVVFGEKLGFTADRILEVLDSGGVASPLFHSKGRSIARGDFTRNLALKYVHEQLELVLEKAEKLGLELPAAKVACATYEQGVKDGRGEEDFSSVVKVLRK